MTKTEQNRILAWRLKVLRFAPEVASGRAVVGDDSTFDSAWQEGRTMTLEHAVRYPLRGQDR